MTGMIILMGANEGFKVPNHLIIALIAKNCVATREPKNSGFCNFV